MTSIKINTSKEKRQEINGRGSITLFFTSDNMKLKFVCMYGVEKRVVSEYYVAYHKFGYYHFMPVGKSVVDWKNQIVKYLREKHTDLTFEKDMSYPKL